MADRMRWRYGETRSVTMAVDVDTAIEIGDLVFQDDGHVRPASDTKPLSLTHVALTPEDLRRLYFAKRFLGVAMQRSRRGDTSPIRVATAGVFEFDYSGPAAQLEDIVGVAMPIAGDVSVIQNQEVTRVLVKPYAIGRIARRPELNATSVLVDIWSTAW